MLNQEYLTSAKILGNYLRKNQWSLTTAESCTGGGFAYYITSVPGSSSWFNAGYITYSNASKQLMLNVPYDSLKTYGAVSAQTAQAMAEGALCKAKSHIAVSITGIAGPLGGSEKKPVGLVFFACMLKGQPAAVIEKYFTGTRQDIRQQAIGFCLSWTLCCIKQPR
jgi:nicotinamide-nucleotide amidase